MAELEIVALDEAGNELEAPQAGDTYVAKRDVSVEADILVTGTVDGRDVAADGALAASATQPGDDVSDLNNDAGYEANAALADQSEAEAGTDNVKTMTALRTLQAITANDPSFVTALIAFPGGGQGSATPLTADRNVVTTCATLGDSVLLPAAVANTRIVVVNRGAAQLAVFPNSSDEVEDQGVDASMPLAPKGVLTLLAIDGTTWVES